ncbi:MAG: hypothetical protein U0871_17640 [Gemmataceae bacterium]
MHLRRPFGTAALVLVLIAPVAPAADYRTRNFTVTAPSAELAKTFGEYAEKYRQEKALEWLGTTMPDWSRPCPLKVEVKMGQAGGATTFTFGSGPDGRGGVLSQEMKIFGDVKQLLNSVLPHEVTHTVLAYRFGQAVPRWADEGGSVLSENDEERYSHDIRCREILNQGRGIQLANLFRMTEYPRDMIVVYAQGYSICQYLIDNGGRRKFLEFVETGMRRGNRNWDEAVQMYGYNSIDEMQAAWLADLKTPPKPLAARALAARPASAAAGSAQTASRGTVETRTSGGSVLPRLEPPVVARGAAPDDRRTVSQAKPASPPLPSLGAPEFPTRR